MIMDIANIPILQSIIDVWNVLMYKSADRHKEKYWLLFDNGHYHAITNIKGFLAVDYFCNTCLECFKQKTTFDNHDCNDKDCKKRKQNKDKRNNKDLLHYFSKGVCHGSQAELEQKINEAKVRMS